MIVYKVDAKEVDKLRLVVGTEGSKLNPMQDADGNWFISLEEVNAKEFEKFFKVDEKSTITDKLVEVIYKPAKTTEVFKSTTPKIK